MTALLDEAVATVRRMSVLDQDVIARTLLELTRKSTGSEPKPRSVSRSESDPLGTPVDSPDDDFRLWPRRGRR